jgi:oxygen-independent coproporphyrinogen-3 oxidase
LQGPIGLYAHIPFCETKCPYCDFNTYSGIERLMPAYIDALCRELTRWGGLLGHPGLSTVFFGGGTPSYLSAADLARVMRELYDAFPALTGAETTLEANPGDVTPEKAAAWLESGFNRVSMGVQSFDDGLLVMLGRRHDAAKAVESFNVLRKAGFMNYSIDLMFGLPDQTLAQWADSLEMALALEPLHLSLYGLQLEGGTPMEAAVRTGKTARPDDDLAAGMYQLAEAQLEAAGFRHYEISNWAIPGYESRHNLAYWENRPYLGVGPGAHSSLMGHRFADMKSPRNYMRSLGVEVDDSASPLGDLLRSAPPVATGIPGSTPPEIREMAERGPVDFIEETTPRLELAETLMMGLRLDSGVSDAAVRERFGAGLRDFFAAEIDLFTREGMMEEAAGAIRLTARGRLLGNEVFGRFVAAAESSSLPG